MARPNPESAFRLYGEFYDTSAGSAGGAGVYPFSLRDFYREWTGSVTPGWPRVKRYNPHSMMLSRFRHRSVVTLDRVNLANPSEWDKIVMLYRSPTFLPPLGSTEEFGVVSHDATAREAVLTKCIDAVQDRKANLAQFIAERRQVERSVTDVVNRVTKAVHSVRRKDVKGVMKALGLTKKPYDFTGNLSKDWLALQYGWKPLLSDARGIAEHFAEKNLNRDVRIKVRKVVKRILPHETYLRNTTFGGPDHIQYHFWEGQTKASCILEFRLVNEFERAGTQLGLTDPLTLAWELVPFSFVVDWFLPIGNFLNRLNYDDGLAWEGGAITLHSQRDYKVNVRAVTYMVGSTRYDFGSEGKIAELQSIRLDRELLTEKPSGLRSLSVKDPFSPLHFANAFALMRTAFGGGRVFKPRPTSPR